RMLWVVWLMPASENWFSKWAEQLPVDCIFTVSRGPWPARRAEPVRVPMGMESWVSDIWLSRWSTSSVMADWRRLNSAMLLCNAVIRPLLSFCRVMSLSYWISPLSMASLTAATTRRLTELDTRVAARSPSRVRRRDRTTIVSTTSTQARTAQAARARWPRVMGARGRRHLRIAHPPFKGGYAANAFPYSPGPALTRAGPEPSP